MDERLRVLVVEDIGTFRDSYIANLELEKYRTDGAANLASAIAALETCAYHAAIVDIMLGGEKDMTNRDGVKVLERIRDLAEGTQSIVVSRQEELQRVRDFLKEYGAFDYLDKKELQLHGVTLLLDMVRKAVDASRLRSIPSWEEVVKPFRGDNSEMIFVSECLRLLNFKGGFENLSASLSVVFRHLFPLCVPKQPAGVARGMKYVDDLGAFRGQYWSKGQGCSVEILLAGSKGKEVLDHHISTFGAEALLERRDRLGLSIAVLALRDSLRGDYLESPLKSTD
jgi:CheY-like chemotaxis protein